MASILLVEHLDVSSNYLTTIMPELKSMDGLKMLSLAENLIESIEPIHGHRRLVELNLNNNKITSLESFSDMPQLRNLVPSLSSNLETGRQYDNEDRGNRPSPAH